MADYLYPIFNNNMASIHRKECFYGSCGTQHHMPRDPRGVLPTYSSINTLIPACGPLRGLWTNCSPSQTQSRSHGKHCRRKSPTDKKVFMEVQVWCEIPTHHWSKKIQIWMHWKGKLVETRERRCSFKCKERQQLKTSGNMKNQWNMIPPTNHNNPLVTNVKNMERCNLPNK